MSFMPHGQCFLWSPGLIATHVGADVIITLAYYSIPATLIYFVRRRTDLVFHWVFLMFGAFIFLCGTTHVVQIWTVWFPDYWMEAWVKIATALVSIATAVALIPLVPRALALRSPAELESVNEALRREIMERERAEKNLRRMTEQLAQQNQDLQEFTRIASHDLQEPLKKVELFSGRLERHLGGDLPEAAVDSIDRLRKASGRMRALITDLLEFSRASAHVTTYEPIDLGSMAREVLDDLEARIVETHAAVDVGDLPTIEADPVQMRQLVQNLLGNALKYHRPETPPMVRIRGESIERDGASFWRITVEDEGIGFEEQYAERIFGAFQRLHGIEEFEGTGIGLALCRKIVERHGGTISATSSPGQGATFTVELPVPSRAPIAVFPLEATDSSE